MQVYPNDIKQPQIEIDIKQGNNKLGQENILELKMNHRQLEQPESHLQNQTSLDQCCECLCSDDNDLDQNEIAAFIDLKKSSNISFNQKEELHMEYLKKLWEILKGQKLQEIYNEEWTNYGFQNRNPTTDFRGGGLKSLLNLISFCKQYPEKVKNMILPDNSFFMAISSINITFYLLKFFHLSEQVDYRRDKQEMCSRKALKNFCTMLKYDDEVLQQIHDLLLIDLFEKCWLKLKSQGKTIMDFGLALDEMRRKNNIAINQRKFQNFQQFQNTYQRIKSNL